MPDSGEGDSGSNQDVQPDAGNKSQDTGDSKQFSQDDLNRFLAAEKRKGQDQLKKATDELEALRAKAQLTGDEREELDKRIEDMQNQLLTKEELAKKEKDKLSKKFEKDITELSEEVTNWKTRYTESTIVRAITDAAVANKALVPEQLVAILRPITTLTEVVSEDGQATGKFMPKIKFPDEDKDGKPITLDLTVSEALTRMREIDKYQNLFQSDGSSGMGRTTHSGGKKFDIRKLATDQEAYRKWRRGE